MKNLIKLLFVGSLLLSGCTAFAEEMKLVSYEVVADCKYPSTRICTTDSNGQEHCSVKQDERCN